MKVIHERVLNMKYEFRKFYLIKAAYDLTTRRASFKIKYLSPCMYWLDVTSSTSLA